MNIEEVKGISQARPMFPGRKASVAACITLAWVAWIAAPTVAAAHGRPPSFNSLQFDPENSQHLIAQATWGAAVSQDGGLTWSWVCASAFGVDPFVEDPHLQIGSGGRAVFATFRGLVVSDPTGCSYDLPEPGLEEVWTISLETHPTEPRTLYSLTSYIEFPDRLWRSPDGGMTWEAIGSSGEAELFDGMAIAPSDPSRIYIGGATIGGDRRFFLFRSDDGGSTIVDHGFAPIELGERLVVPKAVDPTDPDIAYAVVLHFNGEEAPERLVRTEDGGIGWTTVARVPQIADVVTSENGETVWTASKLGGVYRSDDRGQTFERVHASLPVRCLTLHGDALYACVDQTKGGFALARSTDAGANWDPLVRLEEINQMLSCSSDTQVGALCPAWAPLVAEDLGFDLVSRTANGSGGCEVGAPGRGARADLWILIVGSVLLWARRRRRVQPLG